MDRERTVNTVKDFGERGLHTTLSTLGDFKTFILRGNVVDLAVGIVIGAAFTGVVNGFVDDLLKPLIGIIFTPNFANLKLGPTNNPFLIGNLIGVIISFLLTATVVYFFVVRPVNTLNAYYARLRPKKEEDPTTRECPFCLSAVPLKATRCAYCTSQLPPVEIVAKA